MTVQDVEAQEPIEVPPRPTVRVTAALVALLLVAGGSVAFFAARDTDQPSSIASSGVSVEPITRLNADIQVAMDVDATGDQITAVREFAQMSPGIAAYTYISSEDALRELDALLACSSDATHTPPQGTFPAIFRLLVANVEEEQDLVRDLGARAGVDRVFTRSSNVSTGSGSVTATTVVGAAPTTVAIEPSTGAPVTSTSSPGTLATTPASKEVPYEPPDAADCGTAPFGLTVPATPVQPPGPALPPAGEAPADAQSAEAAVREMWTLAFSASTNGGAFYVLHEVYQDHPEVFDGGLPQNKQFRDNLSVKVFDVVFESPTRAAVRYQFDFPALHMTQPPDVGYAVLTADGWRVARETTCALVAKGGRQCPP